MATAVELDKVCKSFGDHAVVRDVSINVRAGEFFSLLGPSGCGKTTTLRMIAGFETPDRGEIRFDGRRVNEVPVVRRNVNLVFQNYALFPHLTVFQNVAFGLEMARTPRGEIPRRVVEALAMVQLTGFEARLPKQLSGGQQQRAALARALVTHPALLLLDEPLGALDLKLRTQMQLELKGLQRRLGLTFIYVTHDQDEALSMSDRVAVMHHGMVVQVGSPREVYEQPAGRFVAEFIGESNFLEATVVDGGRPRALLALDGLRLAARCERPLARGARALVALRPERVVLSRQPLAGLDNQLSGRVATAVYLGTDVRYRIEVSPRLTLSVRAPNHTPGAPLEPGEDIYLGWAADGATLLSPQEP